MIDQLLSIVAPHHCSGCQKSGTLLCDNCKYDIISESYDRCVACGKNISTNGRICNRCRVPYERGWCVGERSDALQMLIGNFKFKNMRAAFRPLADVLDESIPAFPKNTVIVPVPTVSSHIRERGYDHMLLIAKRFARRRNASIDTSLTRVTNTKQRDKGRAERIKQAKTAFACNKPLDPQMVYVIVDDVVTTGATVKYAAETLRSAGAEHVWVVSISRQALD
jgi:ComF family protein